MHSGHKEEHTGDRQRLGRQPGTGVSLSPSHIADAIKADASGSLVPVSILEKQVSGWEALGPRKVVSTTRPHAQPQTRTGAGPLWAMCPPHSHP